jgi:Glycosyltransferase family 87
MIDDARHNGCGRPIRPPADIFTGEWMASFGGALAALYLFYLALLYHSGTWIVDKTGMPIYTDFSIQWTAGLLALHGNAATLADSTAFAKVQAALFPSAGDLYPNWPYPPTFLLLMAPLALLPYRWAFIGWDALSVCGSIAVVYLIVRRRAAIALALAAPFTPWNFLAAQNGFLTAALLGGGLFFLARRPALAGVCIGCLAYKPQFGIMIPIALIVSRQWRTIASATATAVLLAMLAILLFGLGAWRALPHELAAQARLNLFAGPDSNWGYLQSAYGVTRQLHGGDVVAWVVQGMMTAVALAAVCRICRSNVSHALKGATLSAASLIAVPYVFAYDMAALVIPAAFLAADQLDRGLLPGDKSIWIVLFGVPLAALITLGDILGGPTFGGVPAGLAAALALFTAILRRAARRGPEEPTGA